MSSEPGLAPCSRRPPACIDCLSTAGMDVFQLPLQSIQVVEHGPVLNLNMRLRHFVKGTRVVRIDSPCIDAIINPQQCHADAFVVLADKRPETAVCVSIFRTYSWMHNKCPVRRNREDAFFQKSLASRDHEFGGSVSYELSGFYTVRIRCVEDRSGWA